jgi:serine/threonine-protein kinase
MTAWSVLAELAIDEGKHAEAFDDLAHAEALDEHVGDDFARGTLLVVRGNLYEDQGKTQEAIAQHERALALAERIGRRDLMARALTELGLDYAQGNDKERARRYDERAIRLGEEVFGPRHPRLAHVLANYGSLLNDEEKHREARAPLERAITIYTENEGPESGRLVLPLINLSLSYHHDDHEKALALAERALAIGEKTLGHDHPQLARVLLQIGQVQLWRKRPDEARAPLERAIDLGARVDVPPLFLAGARELLGYALAESGREPARARRLVLEARPYFAANNWSEYVKRIDDWLAHHR